MLKILIAAAGSLAVTELVARAAKRLAPKARDIAETIESEYLVLRYKLAYKRYDFFTKRAYAAESKLAERERVWVDRLNAALAEHMDVEAVDYDEHDLDIKQEGQS